MEWNRGGLQLHAINHNYHTSVKHYLRGLLCDFLRRAGGSDSCNWSVVKLWAFLFPSSHPIITWGATTITRKNRCGLTTWGPVIAARCNQPDRVTTSSLFTIRLLVRNYHISPLQRASPVGAASPCRETDMWHPYPPSTVIRHWLEAKFRRRLPR